MGGNNPRPVVGSRRRNSRGARSGFTLIETALATVIVGVGVLAMMAAQQAFHKQNAWSSHAATGQRLGNEIREMTLNLPRHDPVTGDAFWGPEENELFIGDYDDLDDFDGEGAGMVFSASLENGPINARREIIGDMGGWWQVVQISKVDPFNIVSSPGDGDSYLIKVDVVVMYQAPGENEPEEVTTVSWIAPN